MKKESVGNETINLEETFRVLDQSYEDYSMLRRINTGEMPSSEKLKTLRTLIRELFVCQEDLNVVKIILDMAIQYGEKELFRRATAIYRRKYPYEEELKDKIGELLKP